MIGLIRPSIESSNKGRSEANAGIRITARTKIRPAEGTLFEDLQKELKAKIAGVNERLSEKPLNIKTTWNSVEITGPREVSLDIKHDSDKHEDWSLYGKLSPADDDQVKIDLNETEEACFKWQRSCIGAVKLLTLCST
jgi:hypothetical protein